ncbi:MAG: S-adenosylmethionine:tRNA ribosyltransferase-isomerase, partial [Bacteroidales bacterium]|nr:S-adenosylmethionine:tRNA ribosyltransferase-isomerase [Bacteroidales bacterium]
MKKISIDDFDYPLPADRIALFPAEERDRSKLLVYQKGEIKDASFYQLADFLDDKKMLIFNNSKVIHARLPVFNKTGAAIEIFCLEPLFPTPEIALAFAQKERVVWKCLVGNAKKWKEPIDIEVVVNQKPIQIHIEKGHNDDGTFEISFQWDNPSVSFGEWIESYGKIPLPPYIKRENCAEDEQRYQTVYARHEGSVAAPTAGLHFTELQISKLKEKGIAIEYATLHVGAGTFKPVSTQFIEDHVMHADQLIVSKHLIQNFLSEKNRDIIAVGTTVTRTLESLSIMGAKLLLKLPNPFEVSQWEVYENRDFQLFTKEETLSALIVYLENNDQTFIS